MHSRLKHYAKRILGRPTVPPPLDGVADAQWYDAAYSALDAYAVPFWQSHYYFLWCVLADRIRMAHARRIIDIGCGPGQFAACLFALTSIESYTGLDFSAQAVSMARRACPQGHFVVGDATSTTIHDNTTHDLVTCMEVLEHVPEDYVVVERFRAGVRCLCTVPNFPYPSHVRHFNSATEVINRYGAFFDQLEVWPLPRTDENVFFLMDGVRNAHRR